MTTLTDLHFEGEILPVSDEFVMIDYPACSYLHAVGDKPICADKGGRDLGEAGPGIAVPFPTRRYGMVHKHFGIGFYEGGDGGEAGEPFAYAKGVSLTSGHTTKQWLAAALIGETIVLRGKTYQIAAAPNENITLIPV